MEDLIHIQELISGGVFFGRIEVLEVFEKRKEDVVFVFFV